MKTYYIKFERQNYLLAIVKVNATNYDEATKKAALALHSNDDIDEITQEETKRYLEEEDMYLMDENGDETEIED